MTSDLLMPTLRLIKKNFTIYLKKHKKTKIFLSELFFIVLELPLVNIFKFFRCKTERVDLLIVKFSALGDLFIALNVIAKSGIEINSSNCMLVTIGGVEEFIKQEYPKLRLVCIDRYSYITSLQYRVKTLSCLMRIESSILINPTVSKELFTTESIVNAIACKMRYSITDDFHNSSVLSNIYYKYKYHRYIRINEHNEPSSMFNFFKLFKIEQNYVERASVPAGVTKRINNSNYGEYVVLFHDASDSRRIWPEHCFASIANYIQNLNYTVVLIGGKVNDEIVGMCLKSKLINLSGQTTIAEYVEIVRHSMFVVTNETSSYHVAMYVNTNVLCIIGGGHFGRFCPYNSDLFTTPIQLISNKFLPCYNCNWDCIHKDICTYPCIKQIDIDQVKRNVDRMLAYNAV